MGQTTLKELSEMLGISISTVSKALKGYSDISEKTKALVIAKAKELKYQPNSIAQSLRYSKSKTIGLIVPEITHDFFSQVIEGVVKAAELSGYAIILLQSDDSYETEKAQIELLKEKNVDGILISLSDKTVNFKHIEETMDMGIPVVLYDKISKTLDCSKVMVNDRSASRLATEYLIKTGCKKIAHIRGPLKPQTTIDRMFGYKDALMDNNIAYDKTLVYQSENLSLEDGYHLVDQILKDHNDIDAIFSFSDIVALGTLKRLNELNIKIPEQISLVGYSNWFMCEHTSPSLTTVHQPGIEIGQQAVDLLLQELKSSDYNTLEKQSIFLPTKLVIRDSTRKVK